MNRPDYENSILSVVSSVLNHYGVKDCPHPTQKKVDELLKRDPRNVVILLFDGMGINIIEKHLPKDSFLRTHLMTTVSSVFPPTTVAATTTIQSGRSLLEHGWLGWTLYFKEVDDNVSVFFNKLEKTGKSAGKDNLAKTLIPYKNVCQRIQEVNPEVNASVVSMQDNSHTYSVGSTCRKIVRITSRPGKHYVYGYWINPDHLIHQDGIGGKKVHKNLLKINREVEKMSKKLKDTTMIVLADHGLIDTQWIYLCDHPELSKLLVRRPSIESRAVSLFVKSGKQEEFAQLFKKEFGDKFALLTRQEVLDQHLFGYGKENPRVKEFVGDFLAIALDKYSLGYKPMEHPLIGIHAGMTKEELTVPLIVVEK